MQQRCIKRRKSTLRNQKQYYTQMRENAKYLMLKKTPVCFSAGYINPMQKILRARKRTCMKIALYGATGLGF